MKKRMVFFALASLLAFPACFGGGEESSKQSSERKAVITSAQSAVSDAKTFLEAVEAGLKKSLETGVPLPEAFSGITLPPAPQLGEAITELQSLLTESQKEALAKATGINFGSAASRMARKGFAAGGAPDLGLGGILDGLGDDLDIDRLGDRIADWEALLAWLKDWLEDMEELGDIVDAPGKPAPDPAAEDPRTVGNGTCGWYNAGASCEDIDRMKDCMRKQKADECKGVIGDGKFGPIEEIYCFQEGKNTAEQNVACDIFNGGLPPTIECTTRNGGTSKRAVGFFICKDAPPMKIPLPEKADDKGGPAIDDIVPPPPAKGPEEPIVSLNMNNSSG